MDPSEAATTRERLAAGLRADSASLSELCDEFDLSRATVLSHVRHVARSLEETEERLLVAPPRCQECGFENFENPANDPSRCPQCKAENLSDPAFRIE